LDLLDVDPAAWVAIVVSPTDHSHDLVETLLINTGYRARIYRDERAALDVLRKDRTTVSF
jgi:hypothetical protein